MMKHLIKILGMSCLLVSTHTLANTALSKYESAKVAIDYTGLVGNFAQQLAYKFNISYYSFQADPNFKITLQQDKNGSLTTLLHQVNQQLPQQHLILTVINEKPALALVSKQTQRLEQPQYIGDIIFADSEHTDTGKASSKKTEAQSKVEQQIIEVMPTEETPAPEVQEQQKIEQEKNRLGQEKKMSRIIKVSQDAKLLAKYSRPAPIYAIQNQEATQLEAIRSTKLSTFLVFKDQVDANQYVIEANVQDVAKVGNIVGLLHRQRPAPDVITITDSQGNKTVINKTN